MVNEKPLKPCPYCGSTDLSHYEDDLTLAIFCSYCGLRSPLVIKSYYPNPKPETEFKWNAMSRKLKWTKEKPTEPGEYWYRKSPEHSPFIIEVCGSVSNGKIYYLHGDNNEYFLRALDGEFAGPILEPME